MDFCRFRIFQFTRVDQRGQSSVEYIMLFAMIAVLVTTILNSDSFQKIFGRDGTFAKTYKEEIEFSYRHTYRGREAFQQPNYASPQHPSYVDGQTKFFGARDAYPDR